IAPGTEWADELDMHLNTAHIILLLVSADFIASDYCSGIEVKRAMERHEAGEACVIPLIGRYCDWSQAPFRNLQVLPKSGKPIMSFPGAARDKVCYEIAKAIRKAAEELLAKQAIELATKAETELTEKQIEVKK